MVEVTGIDKLGESLLSQAGSRRAQLRKDLKKDQKRQQRAFLIGGALKFLDNAVGERYNNWANSEANLTASRLLRRNQKMQAQREQYETELGNSNLSPMDYEMKLVQEQLTPDVLKQKIPDLKDFSDQNVSDILFGTDTDPGLYKELAKNRLDARNAWAAQIKDFDYETALTQWQKVNPYSKNLLGGAFNFLKRRLGGTPNNTPEQNVQESLAEIKKSNADLQAFYDARNAGLSTEDAVQKIKAQIKVADYKRIGTLLETIKDTENFTVTLPNGNIETVQTPVYKQVYQRADKSTYMITVPFTDGTEEENERSKQFVNSRYAPIKQTETTTDPLTGLTVEKTSTYFLDSDRQIIPGRTNSTIDATSQANQRIISSPTRADLAAGKDEEGYGQLVSMWGTLETFKDHKSVEAYINNLPAPPESDSEAYKAVTLNMGANLQIIKRQLESNYDLDALGFNETDQFKIAGQLLLIDAYAEGEQGKIAAGSTFKGRSTENVDPGKVILAIDLLRSNRQLQFDALPSTDPTIKKSANILSDKELQTRLYNSKFFESNNNAFSLNEEQDGVAYYDAEDIQSINEIQSRVAELGGSASLLDMKIPGINPETGKPETYTVFQWMTNQDMPEPPPDLETNIDEGSTQLSEEIAAQNNFRSRVPKVFRYFIPKKDIPFEEQIRQEFNLNQGDSVVMDTGELDRFNRPIAQTLIYNNGEVNVSRPKGRRSMFKPLVIDDIPEGPIKAYLADKQQQYLDNIEKLKALGLKGENLTSRNLRSGNWSYESANIKSRNNEITRLLNIDGPMLGSGLPGIRNVTSRDERVNFFITPPKETQILEGSPTSPGLRERETKFESSLLSNPEDTDQSIVNLISTAISGTNSNLEPTLVNAVFDIETNASDPIEVRTKEDSGHDAHGIGQIKTSTAVQPGFGADSVFDIADRLGIRYKGTLKTKALNQIRNNQQAGKFVPLKGAAAKEVIRLLQIPEVNTTFSVDYLTALNKRYNGDKEKVLLAYNQGVSVADNWDGDASKLNKESRGYLEKARNLGAL